jgi:Rieske Fe-S protein
MEPVLSRRGILMGGGACTLALCGLTSCSSYGPEASRSSEASTPAQPLEVDSSEIPVGSGTIYSNAQRVITQPTAGTYKAFTAVCTHLQCIVAQVTSTIDCNCHGSRYSITDGSVVRGPATQSLQPYPVKHSGSKLIVS